ncbi:hypothetical protein ACSVDA_05555 [Cytobacillus sp. Hm23]
MKKAIAALLVLAIVLFNIGTVSSNEEALSNNHDQKIPVSFKTLSPIDPDLV